MKMKTLAAVLLCFAMTMTGCGSRSAATRSADTSAQADALGAVEAVDEAANAAGSGAEESTKELLSGTQAGAAPSSSTVETGTAENPETTVTGDVVAPETIAPVETGAAGPMGWEGTNILYESDHGFRLEFPESWADCYDIESDESGDAFYCLEAQTPGCSGLLFSIYYGTGEEYADEYKVTVLPPLLDGTQFYVLYPSARTYPEDAEAEAAYKKMAADVDAVIATFADINAPRNPEGTATGTPTPAVEGAASDTVDGEGNGSGTASGGTTATGTTAGSTTPSSGGTGTSTGTSTGGTSAGGTTPSSGGTGTSTGTSAGSTTSYAGGTGTSSAGSASQSTGSNYAGPSQSTAVSAAGSTETDEGAKAPAKVYTNRHVLAGVMGFTGLVSESPVNNDDGTYYYKSYIVSNGIMTTFVNQAEPIWDLSEQGTEMVKAVLNKLHGTAIHELTVSKSPAYSAQFTYPAYYASFLTGQNEDTSMTKALVLELDGFVLIYSVKAPVDWFDQEIADIAMSNLYVKEKDA